LVSFGGGSGLNDTSWLQGVGVDAGNHVCSGVSGPTSRMLTT